MEKDKRQEEQPKETKKILSFLTFTGFKDLAVDKDTDWHDLRENQK